MAKLSAIPGGRDKQKTYTLVYGLRLYSGEDLTQVGAGEARLQDGTVSQIPLHVIEGTRDQIRAQLLTSIDAFFDIHADETLDMSAQTDHQADEVGETGC